MFHSFGSYEQIPREWNDAGYDVGAVADSIAQLPEPGQGGIFYYDGFIKHWHWSEKYRVDLLCRIR